ncbi:hypothetical protein PoB_005094800 [Plakobranchus ocellatus]|uniref:Peptidase A2 domain-containing protein n=1 Tax=Plakobranchus ocellatus TaxID=259542 RepID=A0AAV4BXT0_9GAST|nr:hypothetical protein PoB_005094800 [Plakobranchus ocellatus]
MAAPKSTLESAWRPSKLLKSLFGGRRIDSVYAETTLARVMITLNTNKKIPYSYCSWQGEMAFTFDESEHFFQKKIYPSSRYENQGKKKNFRRAAAKFHAWDAILHPMVKHGNQCQEGREIFNTWTLPEAEKDTLEFLFEKFEEYCQPKINLILERYKFQFRLQNPTESTEQFVTQLKRLAQNCKFGQLKNEMVRDRLVVGIHNEIESVKERLLRESDLTLEKAITMCQSYELSKQGLKLMEEKQEEVQAVNYKMKGNTNYSPRSTTKFKKAEMKTRLKPENTIKECRKCGKSHPPRNCPAYVKTCLKCGKMNQFQTICHSKFRKKSVNDLDLELEDEIEIETLMIDSVIDYKEEQGCTELKFKIDTGADISVISKKAYDLIQKKSALDACQLNLSSPGGKLSVLGEFVARTVYKVYRGQC